MFRHWGRTKLNLSIRICVVLFSLSLIMVSYQVQANPNPPDRFRFATYSQTTAELFWRRASGDSLVVGYELTRDGSLLGVYDALSYVDSSLIGGNSYEYTITAIDALGNRSQTISLTVDMPASLEDQILMLRQENAELRAQLSLPPSDGSGPAVPILATGQIISYAPGDDGDYQSGVISSVNRFLDNGNGNGTFLDTLTGLTWLGLFDCIEKFTWQAGLNYANEVAANSDLCPGLSDGSDSGDWRVPNIKELYSLVDISDDFPALVDGLPLSGNQSDHFFEEYWSSSSFQPVPESNAFTLDIPFGLIRSYTKTDSAFFIWPVRE